MPTDQTAGIDLDERLAKAAEMNIGGEDDDDDAQLDLESDLLGGNAKPSAAELRASLHKGPDADENDTSALEPLGDEFDEEEEPAEEEVEQPAEEPAAADILKVFAEKGVDVSKYRDADALAEGYANLARKIGERDQLAEYGRELLQNPRGVLEHLQKLVQQAPAAKVEEDDKPDPNLPEWNEEWLDQVGPDGQPIAGADPKIIAKISKYQNYIAKRSREIAYDPRKALMPVLQKDLKKITDEAVRVAIEGLRQEQAQTQFVVAARQEAWGVLQKEKDWIYVDGDHSKGPTPAGLIYKKYIDIAETIQPNGQPLIPDIKMRSEYAKAKAFEELTLSARKNNAPARKAKQAQAASKPVRGGQRTPRSGSWPKGKSLESALMDALNGSNE